MNATQKIQVKSTLDMRQHHKHLWMHLQICAAHNQLAGQNRGNFFVGGVHHLSLLNHLAKICTSGLSLLVKNRPSQSFFHVLV